MNEHPVSVELKPLFPRWVQIPIGLFLGAITLFCGIGSITLIIAPSNEAPIAAPIAGVVMLCLTIWLLEMCFRLITGRQNHGGLMSPRALRIVALMFLLLPIGGLIVGGHYERIGLVTAVPAIVNILAFFGLRRLASLREAAEVTNNISGSHLP